MSAFVVTPKTMDIVVRTICAANRYGQIIEKFAGFHTALPESPEAIGKALYRMNIRAVQDRYPDTVAFPETMPGDIDFAADEEALYHNVAGPGPLRLPTEMLVAGVKAMGCLRYQCSEGNVPESALFKELEKATAAVSYEIVSRMPAYEAAPWG